MQAARFLGHGRIEIITRDRPAARTGHVRLDVLACALCGSELRVLKNGWPVTPGHEIAGRVNEPGHAAHGRRALAYIPVWCGHCPLCTAGDTHLCENMGDLLGWQRDGGYADCVLVPEQCLLFLPDDIPDHLAPLLLDTIGTPAHGLRLAQRVTNHGPVAILGAGPIGLGAVLVAQQLGFSEVHLGEPRAHRLQTGLSLGAHALADNAAARFPIVLESSGVDAARQRALELTAPNGVCVFLGESDTWQINENRAVRRKDFFIARSFYFPIREYTQNLSLLRTHRTQYESLVDAQVPLSGLEKLFSEFASGARLKPQFSSSA